MVEYGQACYKTKCQCQIPKDDGFDTKDCQPFEYCSASSSGSAVCLKDVVADNAVCAKESCACGIKTVDYEKELKKAKDTGQDMTTERTSFVDLCSKDEVCHMKPGIRHQCGPQTSIAPNVMCTAAECLVEGKNGKESVYALCAKDMIGYLYGSQIQCAEAEIKVGDKCPPDKTDPDNKVDVCACSFKVTRVGDKNVNIETIYSKTIERGNICANQGTQLEGVNSVVPVNQDCNDDFCACLVPPAGADKTVLNWGNLGNTICGQFTSCGLNHFGNMALCSSSAIAPGNLCSSEFNCYCQQGENIATRVFVANKDKCHQVPTTATGPNIVNGVQLMGLFATELKEGGICTSSFTGCLCKKETKDPTKPSYAVCKPNEQCGSIGEAATCIKASPHDGKVCQAEQCLCDNENEAKPNSCKKGWFCTRRPDFKCVEKVIEQGGSCDNPTGCVCMDNPVDSKRKPGEPPLAYDFCKNGDICAVHSKDQRMICTNSPVKTAPQETAQTSDFVCKAASGVAGKSAAVLCPTGYRCYTFKNEPRCVKEELLHSHKCKTNEPGCLCKGAQTDPKNFAVCLPDEQCVTEEGTGFQFWEVSPAKDAAKVLPKCLPKPINQKQKCTEVECYCDGTGVLAKSKEAIDSKRFALYAKCPKDYYCYINAAGPACVAPTTDPFSLNDVAISRAGVACMVSLPGNPPINMFKICHYHQTCRYNGKEIWCEDPKDAIRIYNGVFCPSLNKKGCVCMGESTEIDKKTQKKKVLSTTCNPTQLCTVAGTSVKCANTAVKYYECPVGVPCHCTSMSLFRGRKLGFPQYCDIGRIWNSFELNLPKDKAGKTADGLPTQGVDRKPDSILSGVKYQWNKAGMDQVWERLAVENVLAYADPLREAPFLKQKRVRRLARQPARRAFVGI